MPIYGNHLAWQFGTFVVPCFRAYRDHILTDILSGYAKIDEHARRIVDAAYQQMGCSLAEKITAATRAMLPMRQASKAKSTTR